MPVIDLSSSFSTATQIPLDHKAYFITLESMKDLGVLNSKAFRYYDSLIVFCVETKKQYIWREKETPQEKGVLENGFLYPLNTIVNGINYGDKLYNFFEFKQIVGLSSKYRFSTNVNAKRTPGYFNVEGNTLNVGSLSKLIINETDLDGDNLYVLYNSISNSSAEVIVNLRNVLSKIDFGSFTIKSYKWIPNEYVEIEVEEVANLFGGKFNEDELFCFEYKPDPKFIKNIFVFSTMKEAVDGIGVNKLFAWDEKNLEGIPSPNSSTIAYTK